MASRRAFLSLSFSVLPLPSLDFSLPPHSLCSPAICSVFVPRVPLAVARRAQSVPWLRKRTAPSSLTTNECAASDSAFRPTNLHSGSLPSLARSRRSPAAMDALSHGQQYWFNPLCPGFPVDQESWDVQGCFQSTVLTALPAAVLFLVGGFDFPALRRRYKAGERERLPAEGKAAYGLKLVRRPPSSPSMTIGSLASDVVDPALAAHDRVSSPHSSPSRSATSSSSPSRRTGLAVEACTPGRTSASLSAS